MEKFHAGGAVTFGDRVEGFFELGFALCIVHGWLSITSLLCGACHLAFNGHANRQVVLIFYWLKPLLKLRQIQDTLTPTNMRFPIDPPPAVSSVENLYVIQETAGVRPLQAIGAQSQPLLIVRPKRQPVPPTPPRLEGVDTRTQEDRRKKDRRQYVQKVWVDTRLGRDRRQERRRPDDPPAPSIDEEA